MTLTHEQYLAFIDVNMLANEFEPFSLPKVDRAFFKRDLNLITASTETYCIFKYFDSSLTPDRVKSISEQILAYTEQVKKGFTLYCYPVLVMDNVSGNVRTFIRSYCPKHFAKFEVPVILELYSKELFYYTGTPLWGAAMYKNIRKNIEKWFRPPNIITPNFDF